MPRSIYLCRPRGLVSRLYISNCQLSPTCEQIEREREWGVDIQRDDWQFFNSWWLGYDLPKIRFFILLRLTGGRGEQELCGIIYFVSVATQKWRRSNLVLVLVQGPWMNSREREREREEKFNYFLFSFFPLLEDKISAVWRRCRRLGSEKKKCSNLVASSSEVA